MLTRLVIRNFKRFAHAEVELGRTVVCIGPNNSGKTTALQALALWEAGLRRWLEKREKRTGQQAPERRPGVALNRRDLVAVPVPDANLLWRDLHVRNVHTEDGRQQTSNVRIDITVEGVSAERAWVCGLEFDYANEESLYCRPLRLDEAPGAARMPIPAEAGEVRIAFLPPMSGLIATETLLPDGAIDVRLGEGRTAEVLRNLCWKIWRSSPDGWDELRGRMHALFGVEIQAPRHVESRGEISMAFRERGSRVSLDLAVAGRGLQQTLLLLAHLQTHPGSVLLLDEPDAHLEILRQREIYGVLTEAAERRDSQVIAASHSEVLLNEAARRDVVVAFVGRPHRIDDRGSQVLKSLREIGFEDYYLAEQTGWVLYLEGSTDLAVLQAFARRLGHAAGAVLEQPFVRYVANQAQKARDHFHGLSEAKPDLAGYALFDHLPQLPGGDAHLTVTMWSRREIENYLCQPDTLLAWAAAEGGAQGPVIGAVWRREMESAMAQVENALRTLGRDPWSPETKVSDDFLPPLFARFYARLGLPDLMRKTDFHTLAPFVPLEYLQGEVRDVLDGMLRVARQARPVGGEGGTG